MVKKTLLLSVPFCLMVLASAGFVRADEDISNSQGSVSFYAGESITPPINPNQPDPDAPVKPQNPDGSISQGGHGPLSIDFTSDFDFGINPISNKDKIYFAQAQKYLGSTDLTPNYIQVSDHRGTLAGWTLRVLQEGQFKEEKAGKYPELKGASLSLKAPLASSNNEDRGPSVQEVAHLTPKAEALVAQADKGAGAGTWAIRWGQEEELIKQAGKTVKPAVQLFVPGSTGKDPQAYKTTLTWILSSLPNS